MGIIFVLQFSYITIAILYSGFRYVAVSLCEIKILCNIKYLQVSTFGIKTLKLFCAEYLKEPSQRVLDS